MLIVKISTTKRKYPNGTQKRLLSKIKKVKINKKNSKVHEQQQNSIDIDKNGNYLNIELRKCWVILHYFIICSNKSVFFRVLFYLDRSKSIKNEKEKSTSISTQLIFNTVANINNKEDLVCTLSQTAMLWQKMKVRLKFLIKIY